MPWEAQKKGSRWVVVSKESGKVKGTHKSKAEADAQVRALYANVPESSKKGRSLPPKRY